YPNVCTMDAAYVCNVMHCTEIVHCSEYNHSHLSEDTEVEDVEFTNLHVFSDGVRVDAVAWSPETRLDKLPPVIRFCTTAADRKIRLWTSDLQNNCDAKVALSIILYTDKIFAMILAWDLDGNEIISFRLHSPGVSVCWHPEDICKVIDGGGEESGQVLLMSADRCLTNTIKVGAVVATIWMINTTLSRYPLVKRPAHVDKARHFRYIFTNDPINKQSHGIQLSLQPVIIGSASVGAGLSWHRTLPLCVIGGDRKLFWMTEL
uniref:Nucleoporin 37 n=1 Tax=Cyprinus carpio TaxID=7962 RepID=A0A8C2C1G1_CYPCA